jgi:hypothetical protein
MAIDFRWLCFELEHVGGQHAEDSIVVKIPQAQIMFIGDCYCLPTLHLRTSEFETFDGHARRIGKPGI